MPGDVAMVKVSSDYPPEVAVYGAGKWYVGGPRLGSQHGWYADRVEVIRRLVVIDPEDREQVQTLTLALWDADSGLFGARLVEQWVGILQAALRSLIADPKVEEPLGLGALVRADYQDDEGKGFGPAHWARSEDGSWRCLTDGMTDMCVGWPFLTDVTVLSEGVTP